MKPEPKTKIVEGDGDPKHGTSSGYSYHRCRCALCQVFAHAEYQKRKKNKEFIHGTPNGYINYSCRCELCKHAYAEVERKRIDKRSQEIDPDDPRHGLRSFYGAHGCRCDLCVEANTAYLVGYRAYKKKVADG